MFERRNVLEATVSKWNAEVALSWCAPAESAAETVEVVVVREAAQRALGLCQAGEPMSVEDLALKYLPEGLNLAVGPGRGDLGNASGRRQGRTARSSGSHGQQAG